MHTKNELKPSTVDRREYGRMRPVRNEIPMTEPKNQDELEVRFVGRAFSFEQVPGVDLLWDAPERTWMGVYIWAVQIGDVYLANYVGKTSSKRGFEGRLGREYSDWRRGRYTAAVDVDLFLQGRRVFLDLPDGPARDRQLDHQREMLASKYRILLAPLKNDGECRHVEATIVDRLRREPSTCQFLSNRDRDRSYRPAPSPSVALESTLPIVGVSVPVPPRLTFPARPAS